MTSAAESCSVDAAYFEALYAADPDPWGFASSPYETAKYAATLAALPRARYRSGFEIGCSIGVLTARLAEQCDALLAVDYSERALTLAADRCKELPHVSLECMAVPAEFPTGPFDLVVVSEVGYYLSRADLLALRRCVDEALIPGGHLLLAHWTQRIEDCPLSGDEVHSLFLEPGGGDLRHVASHRAPGYRLDLLERGAGRLQAGPHPLGGG